jgi:glycosyltransferase involved in cell wall biosynthesis
MPRIALLSADFSSGGVGRFRIRVAEELLRRGHEVDLVASAKSGVLLPEVPKAARIIELRRASLPLARLAALRADPGLLPGFLRLAAARGHPSSNLRCLPSLVTYMRDCRPDGVLAATAPFNLIAVWARRLAGGQARVIVSERNQLSVETIGGKTWRYDIPYEILRRVYLQADAITAVSDGVRAELAKHAGIPPDRITTIYNPIFDATLQAKASAPLDHPWLRPGEPPVLLGVGTLKPQKDFATLIRAFARVRARRPARLLILGESRSSEADRAHKAELTALPAELGVADDVRFEGFVANPPAYMSRAALFVLSSRWEGLPAVLIEALGSGIPVVSTDCPSGPAEILEGGRFGRLVPVGDDAALTAAIEATLDAPLDRALLRRRGADFSAERSIDRYLSVFFP